ncbi:hypothetical protein HID58_001486 [Brassica napus]|uniref:Uncharacterized protein n=1 Tax=Brassica napus TaxID=3708 RepID=A0ABQ8EJJ7_BRANA|nr:hypothetical protein HID58_001486 [Brassica napus]
MEGVPDLSALLKGKLQMLSTKSSSAGASEVRPVSTDGDVNPEPPAQSSPKRKANRAKAKNRSVPLEEAQPSADVSEVAAKKKKKKESKKRSREETSVGAMETPTAAGNDGAERNDPADSTRGSPEERPKKKLKKKSADGDGTSAPEIPSRSGEPATEVGDGSRDESPSSKGAPSSSARETDITSALSERIVVPEGTTIEERPDGSDPEETGEAIQTDTGDVAAEDPVLVSSSEEREEDGVGVEENGSSPALVEEMVPNLPVPDPSAQVEGLGDQVVEEETIEALDPSRDDQDVVV